VAPVRDGGDPHREAGDRAQGRRASVVPIWFVLDDDGAFIFTTGSGSAKAQAAA
jgi:hypothetical protein